MFVDLNWLLLKLFCAICLMLGSLQGAMVLRRKLKNRNKEEDESYHHDVHGDEGDDEIAHHEMYETGGQSGGDDLGPKPLGRATPSTVFAKASPSTVFAKASPSTVFAKASPSTVFPGGMQSPPQQLPLNLRRKTLVDEIVAKARKKA